MQSLFQYLHMKVSFLLGDSDNGQATKGSIANGEGLCFMVTSHYLTTFIRMKFNFTIK